MRSPSIYQTPDNLFEEKPFDCSKHIVTDYVFDRKDGELIIVEQGKRDIDKEIQAQKSNAGLEYILKMQAMKWGSVQNAIDHFEDEAAYGDVSGIPDNLAEQVDYIQKAQSDAYQLAKKYGLSMEEFSKLDQKAIIDMINKANNPVNSSSEGGSNNE